MAIYPNRRFRAMYAKKKAIGDLRIQVDGLQTKAEKIDKLLQTVENPVPQPENNAPELEQEVSQMKDQIAHLEDKLSVIQWLGIMIILGIVIDIFAKPFLAALPLDLF